MGGDIMHRAVMDGVILGGKITGGEIIARKFLDRVTMGKEEKLRHLKSINLQMFPEPDGIYPRLWREAREEISGAMSVIFVSSLTTDKISED